MSSHIKSLRAERDLREIFFYTQDRWDSEQAIDYLLSLEVSFESLATSPALGKYRPELGASVQSFPHKAHIIFYRQKNDQIEIIRILHGSRNIEATLFSDLV